MEKNKYRMMYVLWRDAASASGWMHDDEVQEFLDKSLLHETIGFLYERTHDELVLMGSRHIDDDQIGDMFRIPIESIVESGWLEHEPNHTAQVSSQVYTVQDYKNLPPSGNPDTKVSGIPGHHTFSP